ncbi:retinol dehydrogenase 12-like [Zophobas morio]|uniref:retinol dehydrogenase 12-like n=1 Tax=Zophobas morio TaxID=2755281 RepID=UPI0030827E90
MFGLIFLTLAISLYIYMRLSRGITRSASCLVGKTAIVTGANSGIGYQTVLNLASRGCRVIMADVADMTQSKEKIIEYTNNPNIVTKFVDLASLQSVRDFASDIVKSEEKLDILINNAGISISKENRTKDGLHPVMQINYFGPFLLTHLLLDLLKKSAPSRIVSTSSSFAFLNTLSVKNLNFNDKRGLFIERFHSYANSKLALIIASDILAEKLKGTGVTCNTIHPGFVATPIMPKLYSLTENIFLNSITRLYWIFYAKNPWEGSQTLVHVAVSKKLEKVTGKYFWDCKPFFKPPAANNKQFCKEIWKATEELVNLKPEEKL